MRTDVAPLPQQRDAAPVGSLKHRGPGLTRTILERYSLVFVWVLMAAVFALTNSAEFWTIGTFKTVFGSQDVLVFLTVAALIPLVIGELDLSIASTMGLSASLVPVLSVLHGWSLGLAIVAAIAAAVVVGVINGFLVVVVGVDSIIATLGMATFLLGIAYAATESTTVGGLPVGMADAVNTRVLGLPISFYYGILLASVLWYVLRHTPLGRHMRFIGSNAEVARLAGVPVHRIRFGAFVFSGLVSGVAGVLFVAGLGGYDPGSSPGLLLPAFAAAFLGTAVIEPGRFNPYGSVIAIYFLVTGITGLQLLGLSGWIRDVFYGAAMVIAVSISALLRRRRT